MSLGFAVAFAAGAHASDWPDQRVAGVFRCRADFSLQPLDGLLKELGALQDDLVRVLGVGRAAEPIEVYLFQNENAYAAYLAKHLPKLPYRRAMYVKGAGPGMVFAYQSEQLPVDLRHECTHALLHAALPHVPLWLDEGLAVYFEQPLERRAFDGPHLAGVRRRAGFGLAVDLAALEALASVSEMDKSHYRDAWAVVHFSLHGPADARQTLRGYLDDLKSQGAAAAPLSQRLHHRRVALDPAIAQHFRGWKR
jgi:hypothetical protein